MQDLRSGRRVVHVVQPDQRVAQERRQQPADVVQLLRIGCRLVDQRAQVHLALLLDVLLGPVAERQRVLLGTAQAMRGKLDFRDARSGLRDQRRVRPSRPSRQLSR